MTTQQLTSTLQQIVTLAKPLAGSYTGLADLLVNYVCIFAHNDNEYNELINAVSQIGTVIKETEPGPIFKITPVETDAGTIQLLKIRKPDLNKPGIGYADFTLPDYNSFKAAHINDPAFKLTVREDYEFLGLVLKDSPVGVYFANPPLDKLLGIN